MPTEVQVYELTQRMLSQTTVFIGNVPPHYTADRSRVYSICFCICQHKSVHMDVSRSAQAVSGRIFGDHSTQDVLGHMFSVTARKMCL